MANPLSNHKQIKTVRVCTLMLTHACNLNCVYCFEKHKSNKMMTFETAKNILEKEFSLFSINAGHNDRLAIEFFGGEPFLNFPIIKEVYEWTIRQQPSFHYIFQITTNGTLLTPEIKNWLTEHKDKFRLIVSIDGTETMQEKNRGCRVSDLPISFVRKVWPDSYFKLTISHDTLNQYAEGVIGLYEQGFRIASSLAEGQTWHEGDDIIYHKELNKISDYFLTHPEKQMEHPFNLLFIEYLDDRIDNPVPHKNCGAGTTIGMYDVDGRTYPCHLFLPMVHGNENVSDDIKDMDFHKPDTLWNVECEGCSIKKICKTCYGYNYSQRGAITKRDMGMCKLRLIEAQTVAAFQIKYFTQNRNNLTDYDLLMLKAALKCYCNITNTALPNT